MVLQAFRKLVKYLLICFKLAFVAIFGFIIGFVIGDKVITSFAIPYQYLDIVFWGCAVAGASVASWIGYKKIIKKERTPVFDFVRATFTAAFITLAAIFFAAIGVEGVLEEIRMNFPKLLHILSEDFIGIMFVIVGGMIGIYVGVKYSLTGRMPPWMKFRGSGDIDLGDLDWDLGGWLERFINNEKEDH